MYIETDKAIYETHFHHAQIEITGCCNMKCEHCRASMEKKMFMPLDAIEKIVCFAKKNAGEEFNLTISGGEPFLHPQLVEILKMAVSYDLGEIVITTNGSLITEPIVRELDQLSKGNLTIQVSLDSVHPAVHNKHRGYEGAYKTAIHSLQMIKKYKNLNSSIRMTVQRNTMNEMEDMVRIAIDSGCVRIGMGSVIPAGRGANDEFVLRPEEKKAFLQELARLKRKYMSSIEVTTEDPLKAVIEDSPWMDLDILAHEGCDGVFGGCTAGIDCFNVDTDYNFTPCSVFRAPILNLGNCQTIEEIEDAYVHSPIVKQMCTRTFDGKCNACSHKRICGGCRATAGYFGEGNYFFSDGTCWLNREGGEAHE